LTGDDVIFHIPGFLGDGDGDGPGGGGTAGTRDRVGKGVRTDECPGRIVSKAAVSGDNGDPPLGAGVLGGGGAGRRSVVGGDAVDRRNNNPRIAKPGIGVSGRRQGRPCRRIVGIDRRIIGVDRWIVGVGGGAISVSAAGGQSEQAEEQEGTG
jgi:hypothetical protein